MISTNAPKRVNSFLKLEPLDYDSDCGRNEQISRVEANYDAAQITDETWDPHWLRGPEAHGY